MDKKKVFLLSAGHLSNDFNNGALPAVIPYLKEAYALSYQATGGIMFAFSLIAAVTQPVFGILSDRIKRPWLVPLGVLLAGLGLGLTGLVSSYWSVLAAVAIGGIGSSLFHPTAARLANIVAGKSKGLALSIFSIGGNAGFVLGPLVAAALMGVFGLQATGFFLILAVATSALLARSVGRMEQIAGLNPGAARDVPHDNDWTQFRRLTLAIIARTVVLNCMHSYLPLYWMHVYGVDKTGGAIVASVFGMVGVMSNVAGGWLSDRLGQGRILRVAFVPMAPALLVFALSENILVSALMLGVLAFTLYFAFSSMVVLGQQFLARNIGFASGVTLGLSGAVGGICAPLMGWIGDHWGLNTSFGCLSVLALVATISAFRVDASVNAQKGSVNANA